MSADVEVAIHAALMARVETVEGFEILWPGPGGAEPSGEHIKVFHVPNESRRRALQGEGTVRRAGLLYLNLFSPLGRYEIAYKARAAEIAGHFPTGLVLTHKTTTLRVHKTDIGRGASDGQHWRTPVVVDYRHP